ncbi:MAG: hypothetical protein Q8S96_22640 [Hydrogenophaga sp.]|uniref:hypothetical protein n=1 Tax=Hydrogenophaga sp. TaxID=1904254 RepID=UPI002717EE29|nr:hypothetical protein [Hydrogenophaga sp.]MDO9480294.1 hypothetical protein [Hydrogenophaga sp.]MDP3347231.1 hypothetical protein [Hydrogenophaga sp.]MDP3808555.1 hypothetical protein [Hydrogenophaga sp.]MDP3921840.1 hypothetical protein [Hydrogenophaga sp.]MDZ4239665.1 hypothetical protein [Hydrogenophaga sp.]
MIHETAVSRLVRRTTRRASTGASVIAVFLPLAAGFGRTDDHNIGIGHVFAAHGSVRIEHRRVVLDPNPPEAACPTEFTQRSMHPCLNRHLESAACWPRQKAD